MTQLLLAISHALADTVVAPFSIFAELVAAAQNNLLDATLVSSYFAAAGYNKILGATVIFANLVTTACNNILDTYITEACLDSFRAVARTVVARYLISADSVAAAYHMILDSNMTHQCLTISNTMSRAVADSFLAFTHSVTVAYNQTFNADMAHRLLVVAAAEARTVARTVAAPFISFANTIAGACAAIQWWIEALICISCGLVIIILLYCACAELHCFFVGNTRRVCQPAEDITSPDVEMEDAPPVKSEMEDGSRVESTSPIACDDPELRHHLYQNPWRIRTPFGWKVINKHDRYSTPQVLMQCPWEDRLMWGPDPAWVTSYNSRLLREDAARKQADQKRFEHRKYGIEYAKWERRCHMSVADKPAYSTPIRPRKVDSDNDKHAEPTSKPQPNIVKSKPTRISEDRLPAANSIRSPVSASVLAPISAAEPAQPAPTETRRAKHVTFAEAELEPIPAAASVHAAAPVPSAAPVHAEHSHESKQAGPVSTSDTEAPGWSTDNQAANRGSA